MHLRGIDLNLLPILTALLRERSVSRAARRLGLSQPATSHALTRLRHLLKDPLLVRAGKAMVLTNRARALLPLCETACAAIGAVVLDNAFEPISAQASFSIATPDYLAILLGRNLLPILRRDAPNITVGLVDVGQHVRDQLKSGEIDLALIAYLPDVVEDLSVIRGFMDPLVCVAASEHPLAQKPAVSWEGIAGYPRLAVGAKPDLFVPPYAQGAAEQISIAASHLMILPYIAGTSHSFAIVPKSLAAQSIPSPDLSIIALEDETARIEYCLAWNPSLDSDQGHAWIRSLLFHIMQKRFNNIGL